VRKKAWISGLMRWLSTVVLRSEFAGARQGSKPDAMGQRRHA
jgi:hypothetical protein